MPNAPELKLAGRPVTFEPLQCWALVEYRDGSRHLEGIIRGPDLLNEPGGAEFPEAIHGQRASLGYVRDDEWGPRWAQCAA
jgi:hypothetical protein